MCMMFLTKKIVLTVRELVEILGTEVSVTVAVVRVRFLEKIASGKQTKAAFFRILRECCFYLHIFYCKYAYRLNSATQKSAQCHKSVILSGASAESKNLRTYGT